MTSEPISAACIITPSHQPVYSTIIASQRPGKNVTAATNAPTTMGGLLNASFSMRYVVHQSEVSNYFLPEFLFIWSGQYWWSECKQGTQKSRISISIKRDFPRLLVYIYIRVHIECSLCRLIRRAEHLIGRHWYIFWQTEGHSIGDHLITGSVSVMPSSVIEASIVHCSVSLWLMWANVQYACSLNTRYTRTFIWNIMAYAATAVTLLGFKLFST
jgi:hypothetical protein